MTPVKDLWFVSGTYTNLKADLKMENALLDYAHTTYLHVIINEDDLPRLVKDIQDKQEELHAKNPRWNRVYITLGNVINFSRGELNDITRSINVGAAVVYLDKVNAMF